MMSLNKTVRRGLALAALLALAGCSEAPEENQTAARDDRPAPPPPPAQTYTPPPPAWTLDDIARPDSVQFPAEFKPRSREVAEVTAAFAACFAEGDAETLSPMLAERDRHVLEAMVGAGEWERASSTLESVRVNSLREESGSFELALGVQGPRGAYLTAWEAVGTGGVWEFQAIAIKPVTADSVAELDNAPLDPPVGTHSGEAGDG